MKHNGKWWVKTQCECGKVSKNKKADLEKKIGTDLKCRSCTMRERNIEALEKDPNYKDALVARLPKGPRDNKLPEQVRRVRQRMTAAKQRCDNPNCTSYKNYGGRGIKFLFPDIVRASDWVIENIGFPPTPKHSLDRIDNDGNYEPGNLRWATRKEQADNRRAFKLGPVGSRIRAIQEVRPDLGYEYIRHHIKRGLSDEQIIERKKYDR